MPQLPPAHHETSKRDSLSGRKIKEKQNKTILDSNSNLAKSMTHHNQTKERSTWFLSHLFDGIVQVTFDDGSGAWCHRVDGYLYPNLTIVQVVGLKRVATVDGNRPIVAESNECTQQHLRGILSGVSPWSEHSCPC
jgi:hypothetical protein